jgi:hypothetical protein
MAFARQVVIIMFSALSICLADAKAQTDTIWTKNGNVVVCKILSYSNESKDLKILVEDKKSRIPLGNIDRYSWNEKLLKGNLDWTTLSCEQFPFMGKDGQDHVIFSLKMGYDGYSSTETFKIFKESIKNAWKNELSNSLNIDEKNNSISFTDIINTEIIELSPVSVGIKTTTTVDFEVNRIDFSVSVDDIVYVNGTDSPKEILIEKYFKKNGQPKSANYQICELCNNIIANRLRETKEILANIIYQLGTTEWFSEFRKNFEEHLRSNATHVLEGIWSADVTLPNGGHYSQFEVAIFRRGTKFVIMPLTPYPPSWDRSIKILESTAEPTVYLMKAKFTDSEYESSGRFFLSPPALAQFSIQVPEYEFQKYLADNQLKYTGDRKVSYSLVKTVIPSNREKNQPATEATTYTGTGFAVSPSGLIATNYHVIEGGTDIVVRKMEGSVEKRLPAKVLLADKQKDLAILQMDMKDSETNSEIPYTILESDLKSGAEIYSIGYPKPNLFASNSNALCY